MSWTAPAFAEIKMDAEIGSYQDDTDRDREGEGPRFVAAAPTAPHATSPVLVE